MYVYIIFMPRMGKKTLYLDLDLTDQIDKALAKIPGKPSFSALLGQHLPAMLEQAERMAAAVAASEKKEERD